ncbi:MAG: cysteine desulfurase family protein [Patescibacteria group bacterium]
MSKKIYLDHASTTPVAEEIVKEMKPYFNEKFGNPSSIHSFGQEARVAIDQSREKIANFLNCDPKEVVFTGSATEANNIFIQGVIEKSDNPHVITSAVEHDAVLKTVKKSKAEVTILPVDEKGFVSLEKLEEEIKDNTVLITVMYANNEIGTIQPVKEIAELVEEKNKDRDTKIYFHTDAAQAAGYLNCNVKDLGVDGLTMSGHKIYGPKGVGVLFKKRNVNIKPIMFGGGQEDGLRSGTYNTPLIVGMAKATELITKEKKKDETEELRDYLIDQVLKIEGSSLNGPKNKRLSNNANFSFRGVEGESIVMILDQEGIATSTGSACSSNSLEPSHVLQAIGMKDLEAHSSLRVSIGRKTNKKKIDKFVKVLQKTITRLREISGR